MFTKPKTFIITLGSELLNQDVLDAEKYPVPATDIYNLEDGTISIIRKKTMQDGDIFMPMAIDKPDLYFLEGKFYIMERTRFPGGISYE